MNIKFLLFLTSALTPKKSLTVPKITITDLLQQKQQRQEKKQRNQKYFISKKCFVVYCYSWKLVKLQYAFSKRAQNFKLLCCFLHFSTIIGKDVVKKTYMGYTSTAGMQKKWYLLLWPAVYLILEYLIVFVQAN